MFRPYAYPETVTEQRKASRAGTDVYRADIRKGLPTLTKEEKAANKAVSEGLRAAREAKAIANAAYKVRVNKAQAGGEAYIPSNEIPAGLAQEIERKAQRSREARELQTEASKKAAKQARYAKQQALREYDATYGTKLGKKAPAVKKYIDEFGQFMGWNELIKAVFNLERFRAVREIDPKIAYAKKLWSAARETEYRPDIKIKFEKKQERIKRATARGVDLQQIWLDAGYRAAAIGAARRELEREMLAQNPAEYAQQKSQQKFQKKMLEERRIARIVVPRYAAAHGIKMNDEGPLRKAEDGFVGTRSEFSARYAQYIRPVGGMLTKEQKEANSRAIKAAWEAAVPYPPAEAMSAMVAMRMRTKPFRPYTGFGSETPYDIMGKGTRSVAYKTPQQQQEAYELAERNYPTPQLVGEKYYAAYGGKPISRGAAADIEAYRRMADARAQRLAEIRAQRQVLEEAESQIGGAQFGDF